MIHGWTMRSTPVRANSSNYQRIKNGFKKPERRGRRQFLFVQRLGKLLESKVRDKKSPSIFIIII
jgi:hypothetical protein